MKTIMEKLKIKWLLLIVILVLFFLIIDTLYLFQLDSVSEKFVGKSTSFKIGLILRLISRPILDLTILYALLFNIKIAETK
jgi:hypothetical protein